MIIDYKVRDINGYFNVIEIESEYLNYLVDITLVKFNRGVPQGFMKIKSNRLVINGSVTDNDKLFIIFSKDFSTFKKIIDNVNNIDRKTIIENKILNILSSYIDIEKKFTFNINKYFLEVSNDEYRFRYDHNENKLYVYYDCYNDVEDLQNLLKDIKDIEKELNKLNDGEKIDYLYWK